MDRHGGQWRNHYSEGMRLAAWVRAVPTTHMLRDCMVGAPLVGLHAMLCALVRKGCNVLCPPSVFLQAASPHPRKPHCTHALSACPGCPSHATCFLALPSSLAHAQYQVLSQVRLCLASLNVRGASTGV